MTSKRALLLSQNGPLPQAVRTLLQNEGIVLEETRSPESALQQLRKQQYALLFARSERLNQTHLHILQYLKEHGVQTPVIISAHKADVEDAIRAVREGAAEVMLSPESEERLLDTVRRTLSQHTSTPEHVSSTQPGELNATQSGGADLPSSVTIRIGTPLFETERVMIMNTLAAIGNNKSRAARLLGISRKTLHNKLAAYSVLPSPGNFLRK